jgi:hypothetical protein
MIADELKSQIDQLSEQQRHELSAYLTKLELENDPDYWKTIRERTSDSSDTRWVNSDQLS